MIPNRTKKDHFRSRLTGKPKDQVGRRIAVPRGTKPGNDKEAIALAFLLERTSYDEGYRRGLWIAISAETWEVLLRSKYRQIVDALKAAGYIEINEKYRAGHFCKSYRLAKAYRRSQVDWFELKRKRQNHWLKRLEPTDRVGLALARMFSLVQLPKSSLGSGWNRLTFQRIHSGQFFVTRCPYGRLHSTFTGLNREARGQLTTINGEPLVEIDVSCCHPLLIAVMASGRLSANQTFAREFGRTGGGDSSKKNPQTTQHPPTPSIPYVPHFLIRRMYKSSWSCVSPEPCTINCSNSVFR